MLSKMTANNKIQIPDHLPLMPIRDSVIFPYMLLSVYVERTSSKRAVEEALSSHRLIFLPSQKNPLTNTISLNSIFKVGTVSIILRMRKLKDGRMKLLVQGLSRADIIKMSMKEDFFSAHINKWTETECSKISGKIKTTILSVQDKLKIISKAGNKYPLDLSIILKDITDPGRLADLVTGHLDFKVNDKQNILETSDPEKRLEKLHRFLKKDVDIINMQSRIKSLVDHSIPSYHEEDPSVKKSSLNIPPNYSGTPEDISETKELVEKILSAGMPEDIKNEALKHTQRLEKMHTESSEASMLRTYLDWLIELPWDKSTTDNYDLERAKQLLEKNHFGLFKVKERILEFLAVRQLNKNNPKLLKGPILCFLGPPGVGKTSLGKSVAHTLGRKYYRISLGGIRDEAEIRGHRRTYVGSMPGKIIQALKHTGSNNPLLVLDEVDKLGADFRGDPCSAMLEVLDPEQNSSFKDHYLNVNFDLSSVMFIATANLLENIPYALRDRMEIITIPGYTPSEKLKIAKTYIIKKQMDSAGVSNKNISFPDEGVNTLISCYTKEAGLRSLNKQIAALCRKVAKKVVLGGKSQTKITPLTIQQLLGPAKFFKEDLLKESKVGVCTGLAWTQCGGEVLYVEAVRVKSFNSTNFVLTGQVGKVMEESAKAAYSYVRMYMEKLGWAPKWFKDNEVHIHIPAGATPKDGPSAGVTLATTLLSLVTNTPVKKHIAMTGEIGLQGQILPVGGIKEKCIAALNHSITHVILPLKNKPDIEVATEKDETLQELKSKLKFIYVENLDEVFTIALEKAPTDKTLLKQIDDEDNKLSSTLAS